MRLEFLQGMNVKLQHEGSASVIAQPNRRRHCFPWSLSTDNDEITGITVDTKNHAAGRGKECEEEDKTSKWTGIHSMERAGKV